MRNLEPGQAISGGYAREGRDGRMPRTVLIVEDEILVAASLEATLEDLGYEPVGIAQDAETALALAARRPAIALVDLNLRDGETGAVVGARLAAEFGVAVLFITANPRRLGRGVPGTLGVLGKPVDEDKVAAAVEYVAQRRRGLAPPPPAAVLPFSP
ncbi:response regulator [Falsiroseomonas bella]|uniref:Response regulator n=1 Tax=Falsiroseomonas bella TaxID=2184016 RepID=A0A317FKN1_9PROT|nr:response regulator [Falsiroseomonas bella]PWS38657.1 response regulator [Falsiroseomonas bella]